MKRTADDRRRGALDRRTRNLKAWLSRAKELKYPNSKPTQESWVEFCTGKARKAERDVKNLQRKLGREVGHAG